MPDPITAEEIIDELTGALDATCKRPLDGNVRGTLRRFVEVTVIAAVDKGAEYQKRRDYLVTNFRRIGDALEKANPGVPVSREELVAACVNQVTKNLERIDREVEEAEKADDKPRLEALRGEGPLCRGFTAAALE